MIPPVIILVMIFLACQPVAVDPPLTFEQRWEPVKQIPAPRELTFEERWEPVKRLPPMLLQNDIGPRIIPVRTIPIRAEPAVYVETQEPSRANTGQVQSAEAVPVPRQRPEVATKTQKVSRIVFRPKDVCARHGMHKEITRGGKSWRCRR